MPNGWGERFDPDLAAISLRRPWPVNERDPSAAGCRWSGLLLRRAQARLRQRGSSILRLGMDRLLEPKQLHFAEPGWDDERQLRSLRPRTDHHPRRRIHHDDL